MERGWLRRWGIPTLGFVLESHTSYASFSPSRLLSSIEFSSLRLTLKKGSRCRNTGARHRSPAMLVPHKSGTLAAVENRRLLANNRTKRWGHRQIDFPVLPVTR
ncbi:hypothetical protein BDW67DRAFT_156248 [Aspergillus spinulosporus]